ncbi:MAG: hypothetical protein IKQ90_06530 [Ruminococcus sp.]|nr:hypothetical protein [Ruminococcus sp.]
MSVLLSDKFRKWQEECDERFRRLKEYEEEINRLVIDAYGMTGEISPEVPDSEVTVRRADVRREVRSFLSYIVGCCAGRFSPDEEGLVYAGGKWQPQRYRSFMPAEDNVIMLSEADDDIIVRTKEFLRRFYGQDVLGENLSFIAENLGGDGRPEDVIRKYFLSDFFADHCRIYHKRPIYWQFSSGRRVAFRCLVYMHRMTPATLGDMLALRVQPEIKKLREQEKQLEKLACESSGDIRRAYRADIKKLAADITELTDYEKLLAETAAKNITIDLDNGVRENYPLFGRLVSPVRGGL